ncbi:MAG: hypothetical protein KJZ54_00040 [Phycisphaerales bacterium]|nr:hypothetical protein [Phycisphaerales bacterium]
MGSARARGWVVSVLSAVVAAAAILSPIPAGEASAGMVQDGTATRGKDVLIFKDGRIVEGRVLEETATEIRFEVKVGTIAAPTVYRKADILEVQRGAATDAPASPAPGVRDERRDASPRVTGDPGAPGIYVMEMTGRIGRDISVTPIRNVLEDARQHKPDVLIVVIDNAWQFGDGRDAPDDAASFGQIFIAEDIEPIFTQEIPQKWGYSPRIIIWVKKAMGGACFIPFNFPEIYFHPDGKMGGIGNLIFQYGNTGDEMVREKLFSAGMGHARGMANHGGYDPRIVTAMARTDYVLSYRMVGGRAELLERLPEGPNEFLLTNDGTKDEFKDTIQALARGEGKNTLTLNAKVARDLGVSKGTVSNLDELLFELQLHRRHNLIEGRAKQIWERWGKDITEGEREIRRLMQEFGRIQVQGDYNQRSAARAQQIRTLQRIQQILKRFEEVASLGLMELEGVPSPQEIDVIIEQIRQEQMKDKR